MLTADPSKCKYVNDSLAKSLVHEKKLVFLFALIGQHNLSADNMTNIFADEKVRERCLDETRDKIVRRYLDYVKRITSPSELCKILRFVEGYNSISPKTNVIPLKFPTYRSPRDSDFYRCTESSIVWEMNAISPTLAGYFFESMVAYTIEHYQVDPSDLSSTLQDVKTTEFDETLFRLIKENGFLVYTRLLTLARRRIIFDSSPINERSFRNTYVYLLWCSMLQACKKTISADHYNECVKMSKYIDKHLDDLYDFHRNLSSNGTIKKLQRESNMIYSGYKRGTVDLGCKEPQEVHGVFDFMSDEYITDIKVCKSNSLNEWFGQLWLYDELFKNTTLPRKYRIINFYTGKVFEWDNPGWERPM